MNFFEPLQMLTTRVTNVDYYSKGWRSALPFEICFLSKVTIYKTGSFQWSSLVQWLNNAVFVQYTHEPNQNFQYEYVYCYTPTQLY